MNPGFLRISLLSLALMLIISYSGNATHLRAGEITVEQSCNSLTFTITVTVYTNTLNTNVLFGGEDDWLSFGDGIRILIPQTDNTLRPDLGDGIATASYTIEHTYSGPGTYIISYSEPNRNEGVLNMDVSVNTRFYIETKITVDPFIGCNHSPKLLVPPIDRACTGVKWFHNPGAYDPNGDSLSYEMVIPFRDKNTTVVNYKNPNDAKFYSNYNTGNEAGTGPPTFTINSIDGTIEWDAPGNLIGEFNIAFIVREWKEIGGQWVSIGFVRRDMQIIVEDCKNERPDLEVPKDICVVAGTKVEADIFGTDPDNHPVKIEAFSEIFDTENFQSPAKLDSLRAGKFIPSNPPAKVKFTWNTVCGHVKQQPYLIIFKISDNPPTGPRLATFKTWRITVVGPAPKWKAPATQVNQATRSVKLMWENYACQNAEKMEVWRKVAKTNLKPDSCQTGMPEWGFTKIKELPITTVEFTDNNEGKGLAEGVEYCYRLVAIFPEPKGGESYVSDEVCIDPLKMNAPIISMVSIKKTHETDGEVEVRWKRPLDRPGPTDQWSYELQRGEGFVSTTYDPIILPWPDGRMPQFNKPDTLSWKDDQNKPKELNTRDKVYNYRVVLYVSGVPTDTSETASTVRLEAQSELQSITLNWSAFVPWSNFQPGLDYRHRIYRVPNGTTTLDNLGPAIDSIDVTAGQGLSFSFDNDNGKPLVQTETYCFVVETRGSYGNPQIRAPLINFSQIICAQPSDSIAPCKPVLAIDMTDCEEFLATASCDASSFKNIIFWNRPEGECGNDIQGYKVYRAAEKDGEYTWIDKGRGIDRKGIVRDTVFEDNGINDTGLNTLAYCYRVSAVDRSGNESELSDPVCNDNCPYYELPNVFSPNGDECNNLFSAFSDRNIVGEDSPCPVIKETNGILKCARFVKKVAFRVYNRWGKEVYRYQSGSERTVYIDWDGRASDGSDLATGVYYYVADVTFDAVDPVKRYQTIKGWVHLIR